MTSLDIKEEVKEEIKKDDILNDSEYVKILTGSCYHKVENPAYNFPFKVDHFQNHSNYCISKDENVLVLAHTGSGKTAVAIYAIAHYLRQNKKIVYTSPVKALSNQKYKEFKELFEVTFAKELGREVSVGLMTGDNKINPNADCVIMTTEILRNALYNIGDAGKTKKDEFFEENFIEQIGCVIFDEVHYINDKDRGHVWEETLIMLDPNITLVMLSATIDKAADFGRWIGNNKKKVVNLTPTDFRVVPLQHYIYLDNDLHRILDNRDAFYSDNFDEASALYRKIEKLNQVNKKFNKLTLINKLVDYMKKKDLLQAIFFTFSRKKCEKYAKKITTQLVTPQESILIDKLFDKYMNSYDEKYRKIPQYNILRELMSKGIAFHHSGLLPIMKEVVEIIFQKGLVKVLFATETFAVGVNMPTRTVVFTELEKYSNNGHRFLQTAEYKQMAGRAGRRGLDKLGNVIILPLHEFPDKTSIKSVMLGKLPHVQSRFEITADFILKIIQSNSSINMEQFLEKSLFKKDNDLLIKETTDNAQQTTNEYSNSSSNSSSYTEEDLKMFKEYQKFDTLESEYFKLGITLNKKQIKDKKKLMNKLSKNPELQSKYTAYINNISMKKELDSNLQDIDNSKNYVKNESTKYANLLQDLGYINNASNKIVTELNSEDVTIKGVIAAQINECNSFILTEMIVQNIFDDLEPDEICALLSIFINDSKSDDKMTINTCKCPTDKIYSRLVKVNEIIDTFIDTEKKYGIDNHNYNYYEISYEYVQVAYTWSRSESQTQKCSFYDILKIIDMYEGNFIKNILKINSIAQDVASLSKIYGNIQIIPKFEQIQELLVRDIVTIESLYL